jgi:hypothetical protein
MHDIERSLMVDFVKFTAIAAPKVWIGSQVIDTIATAHHISNRARVSNICSHELYMFKG